MISQSDLMTLLYCTNNWNGIVYIRNVGRDGQHFSKRRPNSDRMGKWALVKERKKKDTVPFGAGIM
jgi:hypothetical protein